MNVALNLRMGSIAVLVGFVFLSGAERLSAQSSSMFGSRGPAGQIGSNLSGSPVGSSAAFGSNSGMSGQTLSGNSMGFNSFGSPTTTTRTGTTTGQGAFIGRQDGNSGRFTGNQQAGQQGTNRSTGRTARANTARRSTSQSDFNNQNFSNQAGRGGNRSGSSSRMNIRPTQRIAFTYPERSGTTIESNLETRFERVSSRESGLGGVNVSSEPEGVVVLTGEVDSEDNKRLAAVLARLEPGVRSVRNDLAVRGAAQ